MKNTESKERETMGNRLFNRGKYAKPKPSYGRILIRLLVALVLVTVLFVNLFTQVFSVVQYYGDGMAPSLQDRQILLVRKTEQVDRGDIIAFYFNNKVLVRRVIAEGGNSLEIEKNGSVIVDGIKSEESYVEAPALGQCNIDFPYTVPHEEYFVMGDNRPVAMDSRLAEIGTIPKNRIIGKIIFSLG